MTREEYSEYIRELACATSVHLNESTKDLERTLYECHKTICLHSLNRATTDDVQRCYQNLGETINSYCGGKVFSHSLEEEKLETAHYELGWRKTSAMVMKEISIQADAGSHEDIDELNCDLDDDVLLGEKFKSLCRATYDKLCDAKGHIKYYEDLDEIIH